MESIWKRGGIAQFNTNDTKKPLAVLQKRSPPAWVAPCSNYQHPFAPHFGHDARSSQPLASLASYALP